MKKVWCCSQKFRTMGKFHRSLYGMHFWERECGVCLFFFIPARMCWVCINSCKLEGVERTAMERALKFSSYPSHACLQLRSWIEKKHPSDKIPSCCCAIVQLILWIPFLTEYPFLHCHFALCQVGGFIPFLFFFSFQQMETITLFNLFFYNVKWISSINTLICFLINSLWFSSLFAGTLNPECSSVNSVIWLFKGEAVNFMVEVQCWISGSKWILLLQFKTCLFPG